MKKHEGVWLPDYDKHFTATRRVKLYQAGAVDEALKHVRRFRTAVDVGAHVGLITMQLARRFERVVAFEPDSECFECLQRNVADAGLSDHVHMENCALGDHRRRVWLSDALAKNSGNRQVRHDGKGVEVPQVLLDDFSIEHVDFLKIDVQLYEYYVIAGAKKLIRAWRPVCMIESEACDKFPIRYDHTAKEGISLLLDQGGEQVAKAGCDVIVAYPKVENIPFTKYDQRGDYHWQVYTQAKNFLAMFEYVTKYVLSLGGRILDVGCGDGLWTVHMGCQGIDNSPAAIDQAIRHGARAQLGSVWELERFADGRKWDAICLFDTLEHLYEQDEVIQEVGKWTDRILILNPDPCNSPYHTREFTADSLRQFMADLGWRCEFERRFELESEGSEDENAKTFMDFVKDATS